MSESFAYKAKRFATEDIILTFNVLKVNIRIELLHKMLWNQTNEVIAITRMIYWNS